MLLSKLIRLVHQKSTCVDPDIRIVGTGGFLAILEVNSRDEYYNDNPWAGVDYENGDFICIETKQD